LRSLRADQGAAGDGVDARVALRRGAFALDAAILAPAGAVTAVVGRSGAGKTTLLRCLAGLERSPSGRVTVGGESWQDEACGHFVPPHRRALGYVFQEGALFDHLTVRRNLEYGLRRAPAGERRTGTDEVVAALGLEPLLQRRPAGLSGGERRRVALGRALLTQPRLLLLDEPLAGLDAASKAELLPALERVAAAGPPVVYVSHSQPEVMRLAHHAVVLAGGRVAAAGPAGEVLTRLDLLPSLPGEEPAAFADVVVAAHDDAYDLTYVDFGGGRLAVPRQPLPVGGATRVVIAARDVTLALEPPRRQSALNLVAARVLEVREGPSFQATLRLAAGRALLLARITRKSLHDLGLRPGDAVWAEVKAVALLPGAGPERVVS
jgi:molybdate transport system ATP-binding protein